MKKLTKQQLIEKTQGLINDINNYHNDINATPEVFKKGYEADIKLSSLKDEIVHQIMNNFKDVNELKNIIEQEGVTESDYSEKLVKRFVNMNCEDKELQDYVRKLDNGRRSYLEIKKETDQFVNDNPKHQETYNEMLFLSMEQAFKNNVDFKNIEDVEKYIGILEKNKPITDYDFSDCFDSLLERSNKILDKKYEKELNDIISNNNLDEHTLKKINDAKEITTYGSNDSVNMVNKYAENLGEKTNRAQILQDVEYIKNNFKNGEKVELSRQTFRLGDASIEEQVSFAKESIEKRGFLKEDVQKDIYNAVDFILKNDSSGRLDSLAKSRDELEKAIEKGDIDEISKHVDSYNELEKKYSDVVNSLTSHGSQDRFAMNVSMARQCDIPGKFRNDIRGSSLYRLAYNMGNLSKKYDVDLKEYLKDPVKGTQVFYSKMAKESVVNKFAKEHSLVDTFNFLTGRGFMKEYSKAIGSQEELIHVGHCAALVSCMSDANTNSNISATTSLLIDTIGKDVSLENNDYVSENKELKFARIMAVEKEDMNLYAFDTRKRINPETLDVYPEFSISKYVEDGKTTPENILSRIESVKNSKLNNQKWFEDSSKIIANDLLSIPNKEYNKQTKFILDTINTKGINKVSKTDFDIMHAIDLTNKAEKQKEAVESLYNLKKEYDSRSLFWKIFGRDTRRLRNNINNIKETLSESMGEDKLKQDLLELKNNELNKKNDLQAGNEINNDDHERISVNEAKIDNKDSQLSEFNNQKEITKNKEIVAGEE